MLSLRVRLWREVFRAYDIGGKPGFSELSDKRQFNASCAKFYAEIIQ
jgi:hypothetical protein